MIHDAKANLFYMRVNGCQINALSDPWYKMIMLIPIVKHIPNNNITPNRIDITANVYFISLDNIGTQHYTHLLYISITK